MTMRVVKVAILALLVSSLLGPGSLAARQNGQAQNGARNSDAYIQREVGHELAMVPRYTVFDILRYSVSGSEVTLMGQVTQPWVKSDAESAVKHIEGVEKVNDQIEVLPPSPMDDQTRRAEYRAIYSSGDLSRYGEGALQSIHIIVKGGHVTLEGSVVSQQDKDAAGIYAKSVPDVFSVDNQLTVTGSGSK